METNSLAVDWEEGTMSAGGSNFNTLACALIYCTAGFLHYLDVDCSVALDNTLLAFGISHLAVR